MKIRSGFCRAGFVRICCGSQAVIPGPIRTALSDWPISFDALYESRNQLRHESKGLCQIATFKGAIHLGRTTASRARICSDRDTIGVWCRVAVGDITGMGDETGRTAIKTSNLDSENDHDHAKKMIAHGAGSGWRSNTNACTE